MRKFFVFFKNPGRVALSLGAMYLLSNAVSGPSSLISFSFSVLVMFIFVLFPVEPEQKKVEFLKLFVVSGAVLFFVSVQDNVYWGSVFALIGVLCVWSRSMYLDLRISKEFSRQLKNDSVMAAYLGFFSAGVVFFSDEALFAFIGIVIILFFIDLFTPMTTRERVVNRNTVRTLGEDLINVFNFSKHNILFRREKYPDEPEW